MSRLYLSGSTEALMRDGVCCLRWDTGKCRITGMLGKRRAVYTLSLTNLEVGMMFEDIVRSWLRGCQNQPTGRRNVPKS